MKNIILIAKREFLIQVRKKSFIILTLLASLLILGFGALIALMFKANESTHSFNVIDKSGLFQNKLKSDENLKYIYLPEANEASLKASLREMQGLSLIHI